MLVKSTFAFFVELNFGTIDRATLRAMHELQGDWMPKDDHDAMDDATLAMAILAECEDEKTFLKLADDACEINDQERFCY